MVTTIYNSRNYYRLLNIARNPLHHLSTTVEITIGYLTVFVFGVLSASTTVEITIGYLTISLPGRMQISTTVEITIGYLTPFLCFYTIFCLVTIIFDYFFIYFTHIY